MDLIRSLKLVSLINSAQSSYEDVLKLISNEVPLADSNFLAHISLEMIEEKCISDSFQNISNLSDNSNPEANVGFVVCYPFHYFVYKNIIRHLPKAEVIIDLPFMKSGISDWWKVASSIIEVLKKEKIPHRVLRSYYKNPAPFFEKYSILVGHYATRVFHMDCNKNKVKIKAMYGHSKELHNFGAWLHFFDASFVFGPYSQKATNIFTHAELTGNYMFDDWFANKVDIGDSASKISLDKNKKTIVFTPTHSNLSSLEFILPISSQLADSFNVIIKPHYITIHEEKERLDAFKNAVDRRILFVDDFCDSQKLLRLADMVISDNSGAIFDAVLADKRLVLIDFLPDQFFNKEVWDIVVRTEKRWGTPLTYKNSIEQRIKSDPDLQIGTVVRHPEDLVPAIQSLIEKDNFKVIREKLRKRIFSFNDGKCGERAANFIQSCSLEDLKRENFLSLALKAQDAYTFALIPYINKERQQIMSGYLNLFPMYESLDGEGEILFSTVIGSYNSGHIIYRALLELANQQGMNLNRTEIVIVDYGVMDNTAEEVNRFILDNPSLKICCVRLGKVARGYAKNIGTTLARGTFVFFMDLSRPIPSNLLSTFYKCFKKNPEIAGIIGSDLIPSEFRSSAPQINNETNFFMCFRKDVLNRSGGFNRFLPTLENWEFKIRMHQKLMPIYYIPIPKYHDENIKIGDYIERGWACFLLSKLYPKKFLNEMNQNLHNPLLRILLYLGKYRALWL